LTLKQLAAKYKDSSNPRKTAMATAKTHPINDADTLVQYILAENIRHLVLDWDQTIANGHMSNDVFRWMPKQHDPQEQKLWQIAFKNFGGPKNLASFTSFLQSCHQHKLPVSIASLGDATKITQFLSLHNISVGFGQGDRIAHVLGGSNQTDKLNKNKDLEMIQQQGTLQASQLLLVDDSWGNVQDATRAGFQSYWVEAGTGATLMDRLKASDLGKAAFTTAQPEALSERRPCCTIG
jgi:beta-phosphoglucomutase-like phosphatase (HAD superfamily)